jgi:hypothetical protein
MRSPAGLAAALIFVLTLPAAIASSILGPDVPSVVAHIALGAGSIAFAIAVFDFALPRPVNVVGAAAGVALGAIFLLQAVSLVVPNASLYDLAFPVLGMHAERPLLDAILLWFVAMVLFASDGNARLIGLAIVPIAIGLEVASYAGLALGIEVPNLKAVLLAPFVWLALDSLKSRAAAPTAAVLGHRVVGTSAT